jgi:hypothetical protein
LTRAHARKCLRHKGLARSQACAAVPQNDPEKPWTPPQNPDRSGFCQAGPRGLSVAPRPSLLPAHADCRHALARPLVGALPSGPDSGDPLGRVPRASEPEASGIASRVETLLHGSGSPPRPRAHRRQPKATRPMPASPPDFRSRRLGAREETLPRRHPQDAARPRRSASEGLTLIASTKRPTDPTSPQLPS